MLRIRLQRIGRRNEPAFRVVVAEKSTPVKGRFVEILGHYLPTRDPATLEFDKERVQHWIEKGARPTDTVARLLQRNGIKGLEGFIEPYTKKKRKKEPEEPEAAAAAAAQPAVEGSAGKEEEDTTGGEKAEDDTEEAATDTPQESEEQPAAPSDASDEAKGEGSTEDTSEVSDEAEEADSEDDTEEKAS